jgi:hypothetical protein
LEAVSIFVVISLDFVDGHLAEGLMHGNVLAIQAVAAGVAVFTGGEALAVKLEAFRLFTITGFAVLLDMVSTNVLIFDICFAAQNA